MRAQDVVVIGGSAGAIVGLRSILRDLPADFPAAILVVVHTAPDGPGILPAVLGRAGMLPAEPARNGAPIEPGRVYAAPPDHHLLIKPGSIQLSRGPRENRFRPAVDPLFRTAAAAYGRRVIGVLLSSGQGDGVLGLSYIRRSGGGAIVQDPDDAETPGMPGALSRWSHTRTRSSRALWTALGTLEERSALRRGMAAPAASGGRTPSPRRMTTRRGTAKRVARRHDPAQSGSQRPRPARDRDDVEGSVVIRHAGRIGGGRLRG